MGAAADGAAVGPYNVLDLFSGIAGFTLGLERSGGFKTQAFCEISAVCRHLLAHHFPEVRIYDDICTLTAERLAADGITVDAICGGFPCQDISFAGAGAGLDGARSGLFFEIVRLAREIEQRSGHLPLLILENVAALLSRGLGDVLGALAALGYDAWWDCIPASSVGAPHRRDRLWLVAYARSEQHEGYGNAIRRAVAAELLAADAEGDGWVQGISNGSWGPAGDGPGPQPGPLHDSQVVAHAQVRERDDEPASGPSQHQRWLPAGGCSGVDGGQWATEPNVGRVAHGVPARVDRLHGLGNAVVPQIPEVIGRAILAAERERLAA